MTNGSGNLALAAAFPAPRRRIVSVAPTKGLWVAHWNELTGSYFRQDVFALGVTHDGEVHLLFEHDILDDDLDATLRTDAERCQCRGPRPVDDDPNFCGGCGRLVDL